MLAFRERIAMPVVEAASVAKGDRLDGEKTVKQPSHSTRKSIMALSSRG
jgi:hypothetical protein